MALDSYDNLKQALTDWVERDDESFTSMLDDFIGIAEARFAREIRIREMLSSSEETLSEGSRTIALPDDFLDLSYLRVRSPLTNTGRRFLPSVSQTTLDDLSFKSVNDSRCPAWFAVHEEIEFDAAADQDYTVDLRYYSILTPLSDSNASNVLLAKAADVYLYGSLSATAEFLLNDERVPVWESRYVQARETLNLASIRSKHGGPLVTRVSGPTP